MRLITIPNQSSTPKTFMEFDVDGRDGATDGAAAVVFPPLEIPENGKA